MGGSDVSSQFSQRMLQTTQNSASLHAATRIGAQNALYGGPTVENTRRHHLKWKIRSGQHCSTVRTAKILSSLIWKVFTKFIRHSGPIFPIPTSSNPSCQTSSISYIKVFLRTILSNGAQVLLAKKPLTLGSVLCPPIRVYTISKRASHQSLSGLERNTKRCKRSSWVS